jgi:hypothetical protein
MPLVLAGGRGWLMDDFEQLLEDLDLQRDVILLGYVDDPTLQVALSAVLCLCLSFAL